MSQEHCEDIRLESATHHTEHPHNLAHNHRNFSSASSRRTSTNIARIFRKMASSKFAAASLILAFIVLVSLADAHKHSHSHNSSARRRQSSRHLSRTTTAASIFHLLSPVRQQHRQHQSQRHPYYFHYEHDENAGSKVQHIFRRWTPVTGSKSNNARQSRAHKSAQLQSSLPSNVKVLYQLTRITSDDQLPVCDAFQVCNKIDTYSSPWIEKQCRCPAGFSPCSQSLSSNDGHTIAEKSTRQYKICEPVRKLPTCRFFRDITWTITTTAAKSEASLNSLVMSHDDIALTTPTPFTNEAENITRQEIKCQCPPNSVSYISKHQVYKSPDGKLGYRYSFACSPETKLRCRRKEPCRLFTARKRPRVEEVTTNTLCQCGIGFTCPSNHRDASVLLGTSYPLDNIRTYSGYCHPDPLALPIQDEEETGDIHVTTESTSTTTSTTHSTLAHHSNHHHHSHHRKNVSDDNNKNMLSLLR